MKKYELMDEEELMYELEKSTRDIRNSVKYLKGVMSETADYINNIIEEMLKTEAINELLNEDLEDYIDIEAVHKVMELEEVVDKLNTVYYAIR